MTKKVSFFNKLVRGDFYKYFSIITAILSVVVIFVDIPQKRKIISGVIFLVVCIILYFVIWIIANKRTSIKLNIGGTPVKIKSGDIFTQEGLKVIPFNEYYDTKVDDEIISHRSLNGQYIDKNWNQAVDKLDSLISNNTKLKELQLENNVKRNGKTVRYPIGSIIVIDDFVLTAFSKFDNKCILQEIRT